MPSGQRGSRLPIVSFLVKAPSGAQPGAAAFPAGLFLHYNFVSAVLNDVYGIQARGGCACAGPYAQRLLGMDANAITSVESALLDEEAELLRPGFTRISLPWTWGPDAIAFNQAAPSVAELAAPVDATRVLSQYEYVMRAIVRVAQDGWRLLPYYLYDHKSGQWQHRSRLNKFPSRRWLSHMRAPTSDGGASVAVAVAATAAAAAAAAAPPTLASQLVAAEALVACT